MFAQTWTPFSLSLSKKCGSSSQVLSITVEVLLKGAGVWARPFARAAHVAGNSAGCDVVCFSPLQAFRSIAPVFSFWYGRWLCLQCPVLRGLPLGDFICSIRHLFLLWYVVLSGCLYIWLLVQEFLFVSLYVRSVTFFLLLLPVSVPIHFLGCCGEYPVYGCFVEHCACLVLGLLP